MGLLNFCLVNYYCFKWIQWNALVSAFQARTDSFLAKHISFIGFGNISQALCTGLISSGVNPKNIFVSDTDLNKIKKAKNDFGLNSSSDNFDALKFSELVFLCVKPDKILSVLKEIFSGVTEKHILVSVAAGITLKQLNSIASCKARIMPNVAVSVNKGITAYAFDKDCSEENKKLVLTVLQKLGSNIEVKEQEFDLLTAVSGSGTAFWAFLIKEAVNAIELNGLEKDKARKLVLGSLNGTLSLLADNSLTEKELIKKVSSPGGVTETELNVLINSNIQSVFFDALKKGIKKSKRLGNG